MQGNIFYCPLLRGLFVSGVAIHVCVCVFAMCTCVCDKTFMGQAKQLKKILNRKKLET